MHVRRVADVQWLLTTPAGGEDGLQGSESIRCAGVVEVFGHRGEVAVKSTHDLIDSPMECRRQLIDRCRVHGEKARLGGSRGCC